MSSSFIAGISHPYFASHRSRRSPSQRLLSKEQWEREGTSCDVNWRSMPQPCPCTSKIDVKIEIRPPDQTAYGAAKRPSACVQWAIWLSKEMGKPVLSSRGRPVWHMKPRQRRKTPPLSPSDGAIIFFQAINNFPKNVDQISDHRSPALVSWQTEYINPRMLLRSHA
jgi:hypothetical protein